MSMNEKTKVGTTARKSKTANEEDTPQKREEQAKENLKKNIEYVKYILNIKTQRELADKLGVSPASMVSIMKGEVVPSVFPFMDNLSRIPSFTIDELLYMDLSEQEGNYSKDTPKVDESAWGKFVGVYQLFYFNTSAFKGRENRESGDALDYGLLLVYQDRKTKEYLCTAVFGMPYEEMNTRFEKWTAEFWRNNARSMDNVLSYVGTSHLKYKYTGKIEMSNGHVYVSLDFEGKDHVYVILHRPDSNSEFYIGGLGTMVSVSKGGTAKASPCMQVLGISRYKMDVSQEEISRRLLMGFPSIKPRDDKITQLVKLIKSLEQEETRNPVLNAPVVELTEVHKEYIVRGEITKIITDIVEDNLFRVMKISHIDDDEWCHYIKKFAPKKKNK